MIVFYVSLKKEYAFCILVYIVEIVCSNNRVWEVIIFYFSFEDRKCLCCVCVCVRARAPACKWEGKGKDKENVNRIKENKQLIFACDAMQCSSIASILLDFALFNAKNVCWLTGYAAANR